MSLGKMSFGSDMDAWSDLYRVESPEDAHAPGSGSARPSSDLDHGASFFVAEYLRSTRLQPSSFHPYGAGANGQAESTSPMQRQMQSSHSPSSAPFSGNHDFRPRELRARLEHVSGVHAPLVLPFSGNAARGPSIDEKGEPQFRAYTADFAAGARRQPILQRARISEAPFVSSSQDDEKNGADETPDGELPYPAPIETTSRVAPSRQQRDKKRSQAHKESPLALVERRRATTWLGLTYGEIKLVLLAGAGFLMDAYDLFIINIIYPILLVVYYPAGQTQLDWGLNGGVLKAAAACGNVIGQLAFGAAGDWWGRSILYGKELTLVIVTIVLMISAPDQLGGRGVTIWICGFRFLMGIGIGGDYPLSAAVVADRASLKTRGTLLALIFSNQGLGTLAGALMSMIVLAAYKGPATSGDLHKLSGAWRILQGVILVPAIAVLYFRLTLVESSRFVQARYLQDHPDFLNYASAAGMVLVTNASGEEVAIGDLQQHSDWRFSRRHSSSAAASMHTGTQTIAKMPPGSAHRMTHVPAKGSTEAAGQSYRELRQHLRNGITARTGMSFKSVGKAHNEFWTYFARWRHLRKLLGCALAWFLVDVTFYGINLNQTSLLATIGWTQAEDSWDKLFRVATGNLIVILAGFLPGYFITVALVEVVGRKKIQLFGFMANAVIFLVLALRYPHLQEQPIPFFVCFVLLQLTMNAGANATTFIIPAETFPTRIRATAHGVSAAAGKCGSIVSALGFNALASSSSVGHTGVFFIFMGVSMAGFLITILLIDETKGYDPDAVDREELLEHGK